MEENERQAEGESALSPEEIVERAKKENEKLGDERQRGRMAWGNSAGFLAAECAAAVVLLVLTFVRERVPSEIFAILSTGLAAQNIAQAFVCVKKLRAFYFAVSAVIAVCAVLFWVMWILELCGVNL